MHDHDDTNLFKDGGTPQKNEDTRNLSELKKTPETLEQTAPTPSYLGNQSQQVTPPISAEKPSQESTTSGQNTSTPANAPEWMLPIEQQVSSETAAQTMPLSPQTPPDPLPLSPTQTKQTFETYPNRRQHPTEALQQFYDKTNTTYPSPQPGQVQSIQWDFNHPSMTETPKGQYETRNTTVVKRRASDTKFTPLFLGILALFILVIIFVISALSTGRKETKGWTPPRGNTPHVVESSFIEENAEDAIETPVEEENETSANKKDAADNSQPVLNVAEEEYGVTLLPKDIYTKVVSSVVGVQNYVSSSLGSGLAGEGSGVIISEDGYIVTNAHVISGADIISVTLNNGETVVARRVGKDDNTDLAVLKIDKTGLTPASIGRSNDLVVGDSAYAIGNPGGMEFASSMTSGMVSGINRTISDDSGFTIPLIQTDAAINPGNSGGALVNERGQLIGITSSKIVHEGFEGMGFAIPIHEAKVIMDELVAHGYVTGRPMIGIIYNAETDLIDEITAKLYNVPTGVIIQEVDPQSDAYAQGLRPGDILHQLGDTVITSAADVQSVLDTARAGDVLTMQVYRRTNPSRSNDGEYITFEVELMERKD